MEGILLVGEFERLPSLELVDVLRFEKGRRYIYRINDYFIHVVTIGGSTYVEFWHQNFAVPLLVYRVTSKEGLSQIYLVLRSLARSR